MFGIQIVGTKTIVDFPFKSRESAQLQIFKKCFFTNAYEPVEISEENAHEFDILPIDKDI